MNVQTFILRQITKIRIGGRAVLLRKMKLFVQMLLKLPLSILAVPFVLVIRLIRPWLLMRFGSLISSRIGHFAANTELYLCERDAGINNPIQRHVDLFFMACKPLCNQQLANMWKRVLTIWPKWILSPIARVNRLIPGGAIHNIGNNTQCDRDVHNLLDRFPPHLSFSIEEEARGEAALRAMGISLDAPFVCLIVRDSAYLNNHQHGDWNYHNYRDTDIQNYVLASDELADRGYFVIRMGAKVNQAIKSKHKKVIDYATNGMRSDFMDIYLGAKCNFCISVGTGFDAVPLVFRRPTAYVNMVPLGYLYTCRAQGLGITKHHFMVQNDRELSLQDIFTYGIGFSLSSYDYESNGIRLIENTPEEIRDVVIEMADRLKGIWQPIEDDEDLQKRFWEIFPTDQVDVYNGQPLHGEIRARYGANFLRSNPEWLKLGINFD